MRIYILTLFIILLPLFLLGQERGFNSNQAPVLKGIISGKILNIEDKMPVEFATVELLNSKGTIQLNGQLSDEKGKFRFPDIATGKYRLKVSFLGYEDNLGEEFELTLKRPDKNIGDIFLEPMAVELDAVEISDQRSVIENKVDKLVYNVSKDNTLTGGDAVDVLRKVPMLAVDLDGNVSIRGSQQVRILLNGKPSGMFAEDVGDALKMFPADEIENVEVITAPGAKYDGEGAAGIINIITKKKRIEGFSGKASTYVSNRNNSLHLNMSMSKGRFGFNLKGGGYGRLPIEGGSQLFRENFIGNEMITTNQSGVNESSRIGFRGSASAYYDFNAYNSINSSFSLRGRSQNSDGAIFGSIDNPLIND